MLRLRALPQGSLSREGQRLRRYRSHREIADVFGGRCDGDHKIAGYRVPARSLFFRRARLQEPSLLVLGYLGKWRLRGVKRPPQKEATESSHREPRLPGLSCLLNTRPLGKAKPRIVAKREPRPKGREKGGVSGTLRCGRIMLRGLRFANSRARRKFPFIQRLGHLRYFLPQSSSEPDL